MDIQTNQDQHVSESKIPTHEIIMGVSKDKRNSDYYTLHLGFYEGLWTDKEREQELISNFSIFVNRNSYAHAKACDEVSNWIESLVETKGVNQIRFSSGKYLSGENLERKYTNYADADFSQVINKKDRSLGICLMVDKMLKMDRNLFRLLEEENKLKEKRLEE